MQIVILTVLLLILQIVARNIFCKLCKLSVWIILLPFCKLSLKDGANQPVNLLKACF